MGRYPFTFYPKSWFKLIFSHELPNGKTLSLNYFGKNLQLSRDAAGKVSLSETWPLLEKNGMIYTYFDQNGGTPFFDVPTIPEVSDPNWLGYKKLHWVAKVHIQEIAENAVDLPHFAVLHDYHHLPIPNEVHTEGHNLIVDVTTRRHILGKTRNSDLRIVYHGMGCVIANVTSEAVELVAHLTPTPIDEEYLNINLSIIFKKTGNIFKDWINTTFAFATIRKEFERDIMVWERKAYLKRPILCKGDGPVFQVRNWCQSFYS